MSQIASDRSQNGEQAPPDPMAELPNSSEYMSTEDQPREKKPKEEPGENDKCAVCLASDMIDRSGMDACNHEFCHDCLRHWLKQAGTCPVCRQTPAIIITNIREQNERRYTLEQLMQEKEEEERLQRGMAVPLTSEKEILMKRKHELNRIINDIQGSDVRRRRRGEHYGVQAQKEPPRYRDAVTERQAIQLLLDGIEDGSTTRQHVVAHPTFRCLIYLYDCEWSSIDASLNTHLVRFVPRVARENSEAQLARLRPFIATELLVIPLHPVMKKYVRVARNRNNLAEKIFEMTLNWQIHSPAFLKYLWGASVGMSRAGAERFQHEFFEFASSQISMEEHFKMSSYSLPGTLRGNPSDFTVGGLSQPGDNEVITLNDTAVEDDEPVILSDDDEPIFVCSSQGTSGGRNESIYVRDEPMSSGSEGNREDDLFQRRACRMPSSSSAFRSNLSSYFGGNLPPPAFLPIGFNDIINPFGFNPNPLPLLPQPSRYEQLYPFNPPRQQNGREGTDDSNSSNDIVIHNLTDSPTDSTGNGRTNSSPNTEENSPDVMRLTVNSDELQSGSGAEGQNLSASGTPRSHQEDLFEEPREQQEMEQLDANEQQGGSRQRSRDREGSSESHADKYRKKLQKYHGKITSDREKQRAMDWMYDEIRRLRNSMSRRLRNGHPYHHNGQYDRNGGRRRSGGFP